MSIWVPHSAFWDWQLDFGLPYLKYSYTLHAKFGVSKPVIIIDSCVVKSWFTFANLQCLSNCQGQTICISYCLLYLNDQFPIYIFAHWSSMACLPTCRINTQRHLVETENAISNCATKTKLASCLTVPSRVTCEVNNEPTYKWDIMHFREKKQDG